MPWPTGALFAKAHNKKLKGAAANKAAEMATAMVGEGVPEGIAIATANKRGNKMQAAGKPHGGVIKEVAGEPIGKDDGLIPAQRGEYVIRRSAVKKYGKLFLDSVNEGRFKPPGSRWG